MDADEEDFVVFGAPIEREEDTSARKRKAAADAGQLRALPAWKQEVRDEEGRRRFHGAFTGGFSAGFYNTVGSKEGWAPQSFTSSRKNRAEVKQQSIYSFLDDDEKEELGANSLKTSSVFDTFGFTAADLSRKQAEEDQKKRPSVIPGPVPDELVLPTANSIGIKLLLKMGWRHGHSIKDAHNSLYDARREARKAFLALSGNEEKIGSTEIDGPDDGELTRKKLDSIHASQGSPEFLLQQKQDLHGLGYDPFKHAPEFRDRKGSHVAEGSGNRIATLRRRNLFSSNSGKIAPGFGIGALEELDIEDEDIYDSGFQVEETSLGDIEQPSRTIKDIKMLPYHKNKVQGGLSGFKPALDCGYKVERFRPPNIPHDFDPCHKFSAPLEVTAKFFDCNPPPEVSPPSDSNLRVLIEGLATLVCRCGKLFEDLSREKNRDNPMFSFLNGGHGHAYYSRMLWEQQQKHADHKMLVVETKSSVRKMTAESRGRVLGEKPLEKTSIKSVDAPVQTVHFQSNLFDTFTKPSSHSNAELMKPFKEDPAKQERFEQFLKDKFEGGLRSTYSGTSNALSETDRARERLDFEAALEGLQKNEPKYDQASILKFMEGQTDRNTQFTSGVEMGSHSQKEAKSLEKMYPKREEFHWRPAPVLCKRFDIIDPFMGKPPPLPRARSRMDSLVFTSDFTKTVKTEEAPIMQKPSSSREGSMIEKQIDNITEVNEEPVDKGVQKPVDLYKAIFSDDSDVDDDAGRENPVNTPFDDPKKKTEGVNKALNRLVAGDFLESLGKELGLVVPIDEDYTATKISSAQHMEGPRANAVDMAASRETSVYTQRNISGEHKDEVGDLHPSLEVVYHGDQQNEAMTIGYSGESDKMSVELHNLKRETRLESYTSHPKHLEGSKSDKRDIPADRFQDEKGAGTREKTEVPSKTMKTISRHYSSNSSSDSDSARDDGRNKRRLHSKRNRGSESSSDGYDIRLGYKSKRNSSKERSRKHSKHRREKDGNSTRIHSRHRDAKDFSEDEREWRKSRSHNKDSASSRSDSYRKHRRH